MVEVACTKVVEVVCTELGFNLRTLEEVIAVVVGRATSVSTMEGGEDAERKRGGTMPPSIAAISDSKSLTTGPEAEVVGEGARKDILVGATADREGTGVIICAGVEEE